jgi:hypothetical protein
VFLAIASLAPPNDKSANDNRMCVSRGHGQAAVKKSGLTAIRNTDSGFNCGYVEPMTGIEPAYSAWEADVLPLNYIGVPGKYR